ncbi:MAG TPA: ATP-binding protein [Pseudosphingobacterium sp.]|nr:ATP-binding protein [Pseudosphingobacterium sp.]
MPSFIDRSIASVILAQKEKFPILAVTGPRQSGKTTLLKHLFHDYRYITLENPDIRSFASEDPNGFLSQYDGKVILDEVQRTPELFSYIQTKVDESGKMGEFILSGSQNFHLINNITQTLSGRVALFKLLPFDMQEMRNAQLLDKAYSAACFYGFYPAIFDRKIDPSIFYANYIQTYVEKDVTTLINIRDLKTFRTFLGLCASRAGQLLNVSALANACDISQPTAKAWLSILESSYIVFLLNPYHENFNKRLIKSPKLYFYDSGLLCHLLGIRNQEEVQENRLKGNIFENMVIAEFIKHNAHRYLHQEAFFWQDSNQHEVDFLLKKANGFDIFEVKATQTIMPKLFTNMDYFGELAGTQQVNKTLIYGGDENQQRTKYSVTSWRDMGELTTY